MLRSCIRCLHITTAGSESRDAAGFAGLYGGVEPPATVSFVSGDTAAVASKRSPDIEDDSASPISKQRAGMVPTGIRMSEDTTRTGDTETTTDHDTIREWVEERGSTAAQVTEPVGDDPGSLAVVPEGKMDDSVRGISWEAFFEIFEDEELAFVYQIDKDDPDEQWFCTFIEREEMAAGVAGTETAGASAGVGSTEPAEIDADARGDEGEAMGAGAVDEDEIVAGETTSRGATDEEGIDEWTFGDPDGEPRAEESTEGTSVEGEPGMTGEELGTAETAENEPVEGRMGETGPTGEDMSETEPTGEGMRTEDDVVTEEPAEGTPVEGGPGAPPSETGEPAEPLESEVETTDTTEREPLESEAEAGEPEPMETSADAEGVDVEPLESSKSEVEPGEPTPDEEIPTDCEPTEPAETDVGGESIASGSVEGAETDIGGEPIEPDGETGDPGSEPGTDGTDAGSTGAGAGIVDLTAEDEGKAVVDEAGDHLGTVEDVEEEAIHVDPDSEMTDDRMSEFGWDDRERETHRIENDRIREITVTEVVIFRR